MPDNPTGAAGAPKESPSGASTGVPIFVHETDLRRGPEINEQLLAVLPLVGEWAGFGAGIRPVDDSTFTFAQRIKVSHDGRPFLSYESQSWLLADDGSVLRPAFRESGFLRLGPTGDDLELVLADAAGIVQLFVGRSSDRRWELATSVLASSPTAKTVHGERRLYGLIGGELGDELGYASELAFEPGEFRPHLTAKLRRS